ncbi:MAG: two-component regulator propeller domain-containing protein, partial [Bacteroidota bacterium]
TGAFQVITGGPGGLSTNGVNGIHQASDGRVWIATNDGLNALDPETGEVTVYRRTGEPGESFPSAFWWVYEDRDGTLWVGAKRQGLFRFDPESGQFTRSEGFGAQLFDGGDSPRVPVRYIWQDRQRRLWTGTSDGLAVRPEVTGTWRGFTPATDGLPSTHTNVVLEDASGGMWVGTDGGLCRFSPGVLGEVRALTCYRHVPGDASSLGADIVWTAAQDASGQLWAGTIGGGLAKFNPETENWTRLTTADGLPNNTIYGLLPDDQGRLWMTTNAGLASLDVASGEVSVYTVADGLPSNEFDFMAYHRGRDGTMYVGGPHGLTYFHPDRLAPTGDVSPVVISGVRVADQQRPGLVESGDRIEVAHDENFLRFEFASLDFRNPEQNRYRFRLRGYEREWRETDGRQPFAVYTRVPPGDYVFEVQGANRDGVFNPEAVEVMVEIVPAVWQAWWAQGLLALLVVAGLGALAARLHQGRLRRERLADLRERRRIAHRLQTGPVPTLRRVGDDLDALASGDEDHPARAARATVTEVADGLVTVVEELGPPEWDAPPEASGDRAT